MKKLVVCLAVLMAALSCGAQEPAKTGYGSGAPPAIFVPGPIGSIYVDQSTSLVYFCTAITIVNQIPNCTWTQEGGGGAFNTIGAGVNSNAGTFGGSGNTWDFTGATIFKLRVAAGLTTSANGDFGFDSTNNNWHGWNGADLIFAPLAAGFVSGDCGQPTATAGKWVIADTGSACGTGGSGNVSTSGSPLNHQYAIFSPDSTHITGVTPGTAGLPLVSNGTATDPSAQLLPLASLVAPGSAGDFISAVGGVWTDSVPGITADDVSGTTYTVATGDRGHTKRFTGTLASAWALPQAGSTGFANGFFFTAKNVSTSAVDITITPTTSTINGAANLAVHEGQICYIQVTAANNYEANCGWQTLINGNFVTVASGQFGGTVDLTGTVPITLGGTGQTTQTAAFNALAPNPTRAGDVVYYNGTNYVTLAGNNSGTNCFSENATGVPSFAACGGNPTLDQVGNPAASKTFTMGSNSLAFNWTTNAFTWDTAGATPTFGLVSYTTAVTNSPTVTWGASYQNASTPTFAEDSWGCQDVIGAGTNGTSTLTCTHSGTTGSIAVNYPATASLNVGNIGINTTGIKESADNTNITIKGGPDDNSNQGGLTIRGGNVAGGSSNVAAGYGLLQGGNNASTGATSSAGGVEVLAGASTGATQGAQGLLAMVPVYVKGATVTQWNLETESAQMTVADAGASPGYWLCIAEVVGTNTVQCINDGETAVNASAAVTLGHTVCAGTTAGKVTDSGGTAACTLGTGVGVVMATSGTWKFPDGTSVTASTTLPIIQIVRD